MKARCSPAAWPSAATALALALVLPIAALAGQAAGPHAARRLVIDGSTRFAPADIARALRAVDELRRDAHPTAPLERYLRTVERLVVQGYRRAGFADATAIAVPGDNGVRVTIVEGRCHRAGRVRVEGDQPLAGAVHAALTAPRPDEDASRPPRDPFWSDQRPPRLDDVSLSAAWQLAARACGEHGHLAARGRVTTAGGDDGATDLVVHLDDPGPRARVRRTVIDGALDDDAAAVLAHAGLAGGGEWSLARERECRARLEALARYSRIGFDASAHDAGGVIDPLRVVVQRLVEAPPIDATRWPDIEALRRARAWLEDAIAASHHLRVELRLDEVPLPAFADALAVEIRASGQGVIATGDVLALPGGPEITLWTTGRELGIALAATRTFTVIPLDATLQLRLDLDAVRDATGSDRNALRWGVGVASRVDRRIAITIPDAVLHLLLLRDGNGAESSADAITFRSPGDQDAVVMSARVDRTSGAVEFASALQEPGSAVSAALVDEPLAERLRDIESLLVERGGRRVPWPALLAPIVGALPEDVTLPAGRLAAAIAAVAAELAATPSDPRSGASEAFVVPGSAPEQALLHGARVLGERIAAGFPADSWPSVLARTLPDLALQRSEAVWHEFRHDVLALVRGDDIGPLGCLLWSAALESLELSDVAEMFRSRGRRACRFDLLWAEIELLCPDGSLARRALARTGAAWRELPGAGPARADAIADARAGVLWLWERGGERLLSRGLAATR